MLKPSLGGGGNRLRVPEWGIAPQRNVRQHLSTPVIKGARRPPAEITADFADIGPGDVRFTGPLGDIDDISADQLDQVVDAVRIAGPKVPYFAGKLALG